MWEAFIVLIRRADFPRKFVIRTARAWAADWRPGGPLSHLFDAVAVRASVETATREFDETLFR